VTSTGGDVAQLQPFEDSSSLLDDPQALCARFERDGYVLLKGVVDRDLMLEARRAITEVCRAHGWLDPAYNPMAAIPQAGPFVEGEAKYLEVYDDIQRLEAFHAVPHHRSVSRCMTALLGPTAFPHPLSIARLMFPGNDEWATPQHQDYPNNQGTYDLYACWMPLADCAVADGSLSILRGSHTFGVAPLRASLGAGSRRAELDERYDELDWVGGDLALGDALVFHSLTVHRSLPNRGDALRLSVDYRFQREGEALTAGCLEPHFGRLSWDEIYASWQRDALKYYWHDKRFTVAEWDATLHEIEQHEFVDLMKDWLRWRRRHPQGDAATVSAARWAAPEDLPPVEGVRQKQREAPWST
jgi:ectoine hydroxylase-related dioxygenase (phytanoyl-CoA dioxygenase family)